MVLAAPTRSETGSEENHTGVVQNKHQESTMPSFDTDALHTVIPVHDSMFARKHNPGHCTTLLNAVLPLCPLRVAVAAQDVAPLHPPKVQTLLQHES